MALLNNPITTNKAIDIKFDYNANKTYLYNIARTEIVQKAEIYNLLQETINRLDRKIDFDLSFDLKHQYSRELELILRNSNSITIKSQSAQEQEKISSYASSTAWESMEFKYHYFVYNVIEYRTWVKSKLRKVLVWLDDNQAAISDGLSMITDIFNTLESAGHETIQSIGKLGKLTTQGIQTGLELFIFPNLKRAINAINLSEDVVVALLGREIKSRKNLFTVSALADKAYTSYYNTPWYNKWISGSIIQSNLYKIYSESKEEIKNAYTKYTQAQLKEKEEEYSRYFSYY